MKQYFEKVIAKGEINKLTSVFNSFSKYNNAAHMKKADSDSAYEITKPIFNNILPEYEYVGGNFYKHCYPYLPHTDHKKEWGESINVVVPLTNSDAKLIVFDQKWKEDSVTWTFDYEGLSFETNPAVPGRPCDYNIIDSTEQPIPQKLFEDINWGNKTDWFGLSGESYKMTPCNMIVFDNQYIHATSNFEGEKLGVNFRFIKKK